MLLRLVEARPFATYEQAAAIQLIRQMEQMNVLGTMARHMDLETHECRARGQRWPDSVHCLICEGPVDAPPHVCSPVNYWDHTGWRGEQKTRCRICGKDM